jgi:hypothetical protein
MAARAGSIVAEAAGSHTIYVSKPEAVAALIAKGGKKLELRNGSVSRQSANAAEVCRRPHCGAGGASALEDT